MADIPKGYKQSEVGVIPEEWEVKTLGEHSSFRTGPFGSALHCSDYTNDGVPVINPMHIIDGNIFPSRSMTITQSSAQRLAVFQLKAGDIVMGRRGEMGRCAVVHGHKAGWLCGTGSIIIRCGQSLFPAFVQRVLASQRVVGAIEESSVGSTMINLNQGTLAGLLLQCPPLSEQRAIAAALSDVDALMEGLDRLIAKKRDLKQAAMQQLLTGQTRLPGFHGEWDASPFDTVFRKINAKAFQIQTADYQASGSFPIVDQGHIAIVGYSDQADKVFRPPDGGVIVFGDHTCIVKFVNFEFIVGADGTQILATKQGHNARFQAFQLQYCGIEPTGYNRHFKFLKERAYMTPPLPEQAAIASVLSDMDAEIEALERRRAKTADMKQAMMQELLTGKIRLL